MITTTLRPINKNEYYIVLDPVDLSIVFVSDKYHSDWVYFTGTNDVDKPLTVNYDISNAYRIVPPAYHMRNYPKRQVIGITTEATLFTAREIFLNFPEYFI